MLEALEAKKKRCQELEDLLSSHEVLKNKLQYQRYAKERAALAPILKKYDQYIRTQQEIKKMDSLLAEPHDREFITLAQQERKDLETQAASLQRELEEIFTDDDNPDAARNIIMEIRAGTGGLEASLFAGELFRMYSKYAQKKGWKVDVMNTSSSEAGGIKEIIFSVEGENIFKYLQYESGVHRVQRVPTTEASGRIHTSAVTVAVLPEVEDVEVKIDPEDIRVDVYRSSGHGGQSVNTTDSAVRITHIPTNMVVTCQDERSQLKNKIKAMKVLRSRLYEKLREDQVNKIAQDRKSQVGSGDRSEKIRTYNFPDRRVSDHRIGFTVHTLEDIMEGELDEIIAALIAAYKKARLEGKGGLRR